MSDHKRSLRLRRDQQEALAALAKSERLSTSEVIRMLLDEAFAAREENATRSAGFAAGWQEARFSAHGMIKQALETAFASLEAPAAPAAVRRTKRK